MRGTLRSDGGCRPTNPGYAGFAAVLVSGDNKWITSNYLKGKRSNNYAEYCGVLVGLKMAIDVGITEIDIVVDSQLVMNQVNGDWKSKEHSLRPFITEIRSLLAKHYEDDGSEEVRWKIRWEKRDNNKEADHYCTQALIYGQNLNPWTPASIKEKRGLGLILPPSSKPVPVGSA